jgi:hypothetical protein
MSQATSACAYPRILLTVTTSGKCPAQTMQRLSNVLKFCFALPVYQAIGLIAYVRMQQ